MNSSVEEVAPLNVICVQMVQQQGNVVHNTAHLLSMLQDVKECDLLVLPEMWNTGFVVDATAEQFEDAYEQGRETMLHTANALQTMVFGSLICKEGDRLYNRGLAVWADGREVHYDKVHLFGPGGESKHFYAGNERVVVEHKGWRIRLSICYDLRFPVWMRYTAQLPYDLLVCSACWPYPRQETWTALLRARAIENMAYVAGCNRVGEGANSLLYPGRTVLLNARGETIATQQDDCEGLVQATLSFSKLKAQRHRFPTLEDADTFVLS